MMALSEAANIVHGKLFGVDATFMSVVSDSRAVHKGDLFVAISGDRFDGHDFVFQAGESGAAGAMVSTQMQSNMAQVFVSDTTTALGDLASNWRSRFEIPVAAITGSNGKTTVTAMVASILRQCGGCLSPEKSFNNQWGVPLTLLKLNLEHDFAVIEMGTNHQGEIDYLSRLTKPTVALINNIAPAHMEGLGSIHQIADAKCEIFTGLAESGTVVLNADDSLYEYCARHVSAKVKNSRVITFSMKQSADVAANDVSVAWQKSRFKLQITNQTIAVNLPLPGRHNVMNALAASAVSHAVGIDLASIKAGLESTQTVSGRLNIKTGLKGATIIDDSYNANPQSIKAGIDMLSTFPGERILALGAMAELGETSSQLHYEVGQYALKNGVDQFYCLTTPDNSQAADYAKGFGVCARVFDSLDALVSDLMPRLGPDVAILVKGSRSAKMESVVHRLLTDSQDNANGGANQC